MDDQEKTELEKSTDELYRRDAPLIKRVIERGIVASDDGIEEKVTDPLPNASFGSLPAEKPFIKAPSWVRQEHPIFKKILWGALTFFILSVAIAVYLYIQGTNTVSSRNIDIAINAPVSVSASNPFSLDISVQNRNTSVLLNTSLVVDYPEGTKSSGEESGAFVADVLDVGDIKTEEIVKKRSEAVLFGQEGDVKKIKITFKYQIPGSTSLFTKETSYEVKINAAPVVVSVEGVKELQSNQALQFKVKISSNTDRSLKNVVLQASYPFGFSFLAAAPSPYTTDNNTRWVIPELAPNESKEFTIQGSLIGQQGEDKNFNFQIGSVDDPNQSNLSSVFVKTDSLVAITTAFLQSTFVLKTLGNSSDTASPADNVSGFITYKNNLNVPITDAEIKVSFDDKNNLIDENNLSSREGLYNSVDNTISWNKLTSVKLGSIKAGETGEVSFSFPILPSSSISKNISNQMIGLSLNVKGRRVNEKNVPEELSSINSKTLKIVSEVDLGGRIVYSTGPFQNTGPFPPRANQPTTYTVIWSITNSLNNVTDGKVTATLPPYVTFGGVFSPSTDKFTYDKNKNQVTWDIGSIQAGLGFRNSPRELSFKIILNPLLTQVSETPTLINKTTFTGTDSFTGTALQDTVEGLNTNLDTDPNFNVGDDKVRQ